MYKKFAFLFISLLFIPAALAHADSITFSGATDITAEATSSAGAYVAFTVTAEDASSTPLAVSCDHGSGSLFALGTTTVSCSASDSSFATSTTSFGIGVVDTTPPTITPPDTQFFATTTLPALPALASATATDLVDPSPAVTYDPHSFSVGTTTVTWTATDASGNASATTSLVIVTSDSTSTTTSDTVTFSIRDGATLVGPATIDLPNASSSDVSLAATGTTTTHTVPAQSILALLSSYDASSSAFGITELYYYDSYASFYVNCISVPAATSSPLCGEWQYVVNGADPGVGMDHETLSPGDSVIVYFGTPRQVALSTTSVAAGTAFTATAETYDPATDTLSPTSGVILGVISIPDPSTPWIYTEIATSSSDANGQAIFTLNATGTYQVGIEEDYYSPSQSITITAATSGTSGGSGGGGGGGSIAHTNLSVPNALSFLSSKQSADGSYSSPVITDWVAIAFATSDPGAAKTKLKRYLLTATPPMGSAADYERHAMALEAFGINPYSGTLVDYLSPIVAAFDGTQIGDPSLDNDDIFALFALLHAGYSSGDTIIQKDAAFILSRQKPDGSWDESPDMTAAAIDALGPLYDIAGVNQALGAAVGYLLSGQQPTGGWSNVDSTSWAQTAINGIIAAHTPGFSTESSFASSAGYWPTDALASTQQGDGGVRPQSDPSDTRTWSTSYAVVAASGWDWSTLLQSFAKPSAPSNTGGGGGSDGIVLGASTSTVASSTQESATTTPAIATTTVAIASSTIASTSTPALRPATTTPKKPTVSPPAKKKAPPLQVPATTTSLLQTQTASAAESGGNIFSSIWHAVTSFFSSLF